MVQFESYITIVLIHYRSCGKKIYLIIYSYRNGIPQHRKSACRSFILKREVTIFHFIHVRGISKETDFIRGGIVRPKLDRTIRPCSLILLFFHKLVIHKIRYGSIPVEFSMCKICKHSHILKFISSGKFPDSSRHRNNSGKADRNILLRKSALTFFPTACSQQQK